MPSYNTLYSIFDEKGNLVTHSTNSACFAQIFSSENKEDANWGFHKGRYMEIYQFTPENFYFENHHQYYHVKSFDLAKRWVNTLNKWGLKCSIEERVMSRKIPNCDNVAKNWENVKTIVFRVNYDDYESKNQFKLTCYFLRWIWEVCPEYLSNIYKIKDKYPKASVFELIQVVFLCFHGNVSCYFSGHGSGLSFAGRTVVKLSDFKRTFKNATDWDNNFTTTIWLNAGAKNMTFDQSGKIKDTLRITNLEDFNYDEYLKIKEKYFLS